MSDRLRRLFAEPLPDAGGELGLPAQSAQHARVLRLAQGAQVELFDGKGGQAEAMVCEVSRARVACRAQPRSQLPPPASRLQLVLALPKGKKLEDIARMLGELGATGLHLALSERSVPRPDQLSARLERLKRIALEACAQSGQAWALQLHAPQPLLQIAAAAPRDARRLVFWERARAPLRDALPEPIVSEVWAVIGPEGGLSEAEVEALQALGFGPVGLGRARLRVETAVPAIAALLLERMGALRG